MSCPVMPLTSQMVDGPTTTSSRPAFATIVYSSHVMAHAKRKVYEAGRGWAILGGRRMPNRLIHESSPYLRQHAHNPVDWYPWGEEAFARARAENKPVLLSIGYSACHWCHVMERESFEDEA